MTNGPCTVIDSVFVRVDSLPADIGIDPVPDKLYYCPGDTVAFLSPIYEPALYPNIDHEWLADPTIVTPLDAYNLLLYADETQVYTRISTNNACADTVSYLLQVVDPVFPLLFTDTTICPGDTVRLKMENDELEPDDILVWTPNANLSCDDCPNPLASPMVSTEYTISGTLKGCPAENSVFVGVFDTYEVTLDAEPDVEVFQGSDVNIISTLEPDNPVGLYNWFVNADSIDHDSMSLYYKSLLEETSFKLVYIDENGCISADSILITIIEAMWDVPDVFTPNNDGLNDVFKVVTNGNPNLELVRFSIFNRWGERVYETTDVNQGWDGTIDGKDAPSDSYILIMEIEFPTGVRETREKDFLLLR
jgi:gliding motility-associated-like protein